MTTTTELLTQLAAAKIAHNAARVACCERALATIAEITLLADAWHVDEGYTHPPDGAQWISGSTRIHAAEWSAIVDRVRVLGATYQDLETVERALEHLHSRFDQKIAEIKGFEGRLNARHTIR